MKNREKVVAVVVGSTSTSSSRSRSRRRRRRRRSSTSSSSSSRRSSRSSSSSLSSRRLGCLGLAVPNLLEMHGHGYSLIPLNGRSCGQQDHENIISWQARFGKFRFRGVEVRSGGGCSVPPWRSGLVQGLKSDPERTAARSMWNLSDKIVYLVLCCHFMCVFSFLLFPFWFCSRLDL